MAQRTQVLLIDDLDGSSADETLTFGLDGAAYEIDLSAANAGLLRKALADYVAARPARELTRQRPPPRRRPHPHTASAADTAVRARLGTRERLLGQRPRPHRRRRSSTPTRLLTDAACRAASARRRCARFALRCQRKPCPRRIQGTVHERNEVEWGRICDSRSASLLSTTPSPPMGPSRDVARTSTGLACEQAVVSTGWRGGRLARRSTTCSRGSPTGPGGSSSWRKKKPGCSTTTTSAPSTSCWV